MASVNFKTISTEEISLLRPPRRQHAHHWRLADAGAGSVTPAYCLDCGAQRTFPTSHWQDDAPSASWRKAGLGKRQGRNRR